MGLAYAGIELGVPFYKEQSQLIVIDRPGGQGEAISFIQLKYQIMFWDTISQKELIQVESNL